MPADGAEPVVIPADLWQRPDMHTALTHRDIGHLFRLVRQYAGISQTRIGVAVGFSQGKVSEYMQGKAQVTALDVFERIADGLHMPDPARITLGLAPRILTGVPHPPTPIPPRDGTPASSLLSVEQVVIGSRQPDDTCDVDMLTLAWIVGRLDGHMDRRTMLLIAAGLTAESAASIANPWERLTLALSGTRADQEDTVERLEARTIGFHRLEETMPARSLYQGLTAHLNELSTLLQAGLTDRLRRRLAATTGEAAVLASWIAWEIKQPGQSAAFDRIATLAAEESGHPIIQACAYGYRSYATRGAPAVQNIRLAQQYLPAQGDNATRAWLLAREAEELANLGDRQALIRLEEARDAYGEARPQRERAWTRFLDSGRMAAYRLSTYVNLGDEHRVIDEGQAALNALSHETDHKKIAAVHADIAAAQLRIGDLNEGITSGRPALETAQRTESRRAFQQLAGVENALTGKRDASARELLAAINSAHRSLSQPSA
ncbi:helix-turn-helix domain-containing protein [Nonomuraea sp. K274]|uniref:Helix-turn-helix domain-containing protein n=1 Tax=Nonomuraea cypriaca TaxID=1187855 RepID=A0A931F5J5_9ACTN|nr:helix-turn-helix domain-containing protein [Nonomuraea cypriaca]MBF8193762.1 helix-turn-helix domain-containing protein [Nonomuraea cypriaca]